MKVMKGDEFLKEAKESRKAFVKKALEGKAKWGAWRYNPNNLTLEIDSEVCGYPEGDFYYVDLEECNTSAEVLDWLCQILGKEWGSEHVGNLLAAIDDLADGLQDVMCSFGRNVRFDMGKHLRGMDRERYKKLLTVEEVADVLRTTKLSVYRMIERGDIEAVELPLGRDGELRISSTEVDRILAVKKKPKLRKGKSLRSEGKEPAE